MSSSGSELIGALALSVSVSDDALVADLADGRTITVPLAWFPRLAHGTPTERANWRLIAGGEGIHWPDLDEDISVDSLLAGRRSGETQESLRRWLQRRDSAAQARNHPVFSGKGTQTVSHAETINLTRLEALMPN